MGARRDKDDPPAEVLPGLPPGWYPELVLSGFLPGRSWKKGAPQGYSIRPVPAGSAGREDIAGELFRHGDEFSPGHSRPVQIVPDRQGSQGPSVHRRMAGGGGEFPSVGEPEVNEEMGGRDPGLCRPEKGNGHPASFRTGGPHGHSLTEILHRYGAIRRVDEGITREADGTGENGVVELLAKNDTIRPDCARHQLSLPCCTYPQVEGIDICRQGIEGNGIEFLVLAVDGEDGVIGVGRLESLPGCDGCEDVCLFLDDGEYRDGTFQLVTPAHRVIVGVAVEELVFPVMVEEEVFQLGRGIGRVPLGRRSTPETTGEEEGGYQEEDELGLHA